MWSRPEGKDECNSGVWQGACYVKKHDNVFAFQTYEITFASECGEMPRILFKKTGETEMAAKKTAAKKAPAKKTAKKAPAKKAVAKMKLPSPSPQFSSTRSPNHPWTSCDAICGLLASYYASQLLGGCCRKEQTMTP